MNCKYIIIIKCRHVDYIRTVYSDHYIRSKNGYICVKYNNCTISEKYERMKIY